VTNSWTHCQYPTTKCTSQAGDFTVLTMKKKSKIQNMVAIENMAHDLGVQQEDLTAWLIDQSAEISKDFMGRDAVPQNSKQYLHHQRNTKHL
jgi:hypothetical protein